MIDSPTTFHGLEVARYALRTFALDGYNRQLLPVREQIPSWREHSVWRGGECMAYCELGRLHAAPAEDCDCGIYGATNLGSLLMDYPHLASRIVAVIAVQGATIVGSEGLRTAAARVVAYWCKPTPEPDLGREIFAEQCPHAVAFTDCDAMLAAYGLRITPPVPELTSSDVDCPELAGTGGDASPPMYGRAPRGRVRTAVDAVLTLYWPVLAPVLLAGLLIGAEVHVAGMAAVAAGSRIWVAVAGVLSSVRDLVTTLILCAPPVFVFGPPAAVFILSLGITWYGGRRDWSNWPAVIQRSARASARFGLRVAIFALAYILFAGLPFSATLATTALMAWIVYGYTTKPLRDLLSHAAARLTASIADTARNFAGHLTGRRRSPTRRAVQRSSTIATAIDPRRRLARLPHPASQNGRRTPVTDRPAEMKRPAIADQAEGSCA
jgi:hypothetical protein